MRQLTNLLRTAWLVFDATVWTVFVGIGVGLPFIVAGRAGVLPQLLRDALGWRLIGILPAILGIGLYLWSASSFITAGRGTPNLFNSPRRVVAVGPYRFVRNPMYGAVLLVLIGEYVLLDDIRVLLYATLIMLWLLFFVVAIEEPILQDRFGEAYHQYCRSVPRWLPRRPGRMRDELQP